MSSGKTVVVPRVVSKPLSDSYVILVSHTHHPRGNSDPLEVLSTVKPAICCNRGCWIHENFPNLGKDVKLYNDFYQESLRPLLNSIPIKESFKLESWLAYKEYNATYGADTIEHITTVVNDEKELRPVVVWLHDYQLLLAANTIRALAAERGLPVKIGLVLYKPFPAWDVFRICPWAEEILLGILACDVVGVQAESHRDNFIDSCRRRLGCRVDVAKGLVEHGSHACAVRVVPGGVPYAEVEEIARDPGIVSMAHRSDPSVKQIVSYDTKDRAGEALYKLQAFEALLAEYPEHVHKVEWVQVEDYTNLITPCESYIPLANAIETRLKKDTVKIISNIQSKQDLISILKNADVALIGSSLADEPCLVAKAFVASQIENPTGVLVLSNFSTAAETMKEALRCNPCHIKETAEILHKALTMPEDERLVRMNFLKRREKLNELFAWARSFISELEQYDGVRSSFEPVTLLEIDSYMRSYVGNCQKLAVLLDFDGTLAPLCPHPDLSKMPAQTKDVLEKLSKMPEVFIAMISGRNVNNLKEMVGIEGITYAGNHGMEILHSDGTKFVYKIPEDFIKRAEELFKGIEAKLCRDGAWLERKGSLMTYHYRSTPAELRPALIEETMALIKKAGFRGNMAHCSIEAKPPVQWNKGRAAVHILCKEFGHDWTDRIRVVFAGDDTTDEDAMEVLKGMAATFRIAPPTITKSWAERRVPDTLAIQTLLKWIERHYRT